MRSSSERFDCDCICVSLLLLTHLVYTRVPGQHST